MFMDENHEHDSNYESDMVTSDYQICQEIICQILDDLFNYGAHEAFLNFIPSASAQCWLSHRAIRLDERVNSSWMLEGCERRLNEDLNNWIMASVNCSCETSSYLSEEDNIKNKFYNAAHTYLSQDDVDHSFRWELFRLMRQWDAATGRRVPPYVLSKLYVGESASIILDECRFSQCSSDIPVFFYNSNHHQRYDNLVDRYHNNIHFMYYQIQLLRDLILFGLPTSVHSQSTMVGAFTARSSQVDYGERKKIEEFCHNYQPSSVLNEYTKDSFFHRVINEILRQERYDIIYQYRHAIIDLIERLRRPLPSEEDSVPLFLYRGQQMTLFELEKMRNNVGELFSTSSFFSTTFNLKLAQNFAGDGTDDNPYLVSVIFKIYLDTGQPIRPYALIPNSAEEETLFSPGTKFILMSCRKLHDNARLWLLELKAVPEQQQQQQQQLALNHGNTFLLLSSASGWPTQS